LIAVALVLFVSPGLLTGCFAKTPPKPESPTAAVVEGRTITIDDVDGDIKEQLFSERFPSNREVVLYETRRDTLEKMIDTAVLDRAARGSGLAPQAWLESEVARLDPVTDEEIDAFWKQFEDRIPKDRPEEQIRSDIRAYLVVEHGKTIIDGLRESAEVRVVLARPRHSVEISGTPRGPADAPITIVEFSDFQCPFCLRASAVVREVLDRYPEQVRVYYRHLPLPNHPRARAAAIASVCAERQGQFWAYHDRLFADPHAMSDEHLRTRAQALELDLAAFDACVASDEAAARVDADIAAADAVGASGTPVFFVNGIRLTGAQPIESFVRVIDEELEALSAE
jgi:protein-disulfide isomerase